MPTPSCFRAVSFAALTLLLPVAKAAVVVSNLAETTHVAATVDANFRVAQSFVAGADATLEAVNLDLSLNPLGTGLSVALHADAAGVPASSALAPLSGGAGQSRFEALTSPALAAGITYWIVASATAPKVEWDGTSSGTETGEAGWSLGDLHRENGFGFGWTLVSDALQMSLEIAAVPEPAAFTGAVGSALLGWAAWRCQRRRSQRATGVAPAASRSLARSPSSGPGTTGAKVLPASHRQS